MGDAYDYVRNQPPIKDSGKRAEFDSGMIRDTSEDKIDWTGIFIGPMAERWAWHTTKGRQKYPDPEPGVPNWTLARGMPEWIRFRASALRHFMQWFFGHTDEDHAAAVFFNINGAEYVKEKIDGPFDEPEGDGSFRPQRDPD